ncbi:hypothetical protein [Desulfonatronovibrio magnus]|uniref:hypothetical protein n=1 Tax=Desulfonatronovibrio magnus TaxID=698827 RepID=UPI0012F7EFA0|nr:hypothetical protein [Desulfonatronovibrio magnus]
MATKTFRTIYMTPDMDQRLVKAAEQERSSASRLVRLALEKFFEKQAEHSNKRVKKED